MRRRTWNRTVCDSSSRVNVTVCSAGVDVQPCGMLERDDALGRALAIVDDRDANLSRRAARAGGGGGGRRRWRRASPRAAAAGRVAAGAGVPPRPSAGASRPAGVGASADWQRAASIGTIATSGEITRTDSAGTTSSSDRFSPLKMSPS